jgi:hypothetical protein
MGVDECEWMEGRFAVVSLASRRTQIKKEETQVVNHRGLRMKLSGIRSIYIIQHLSTMTFAIGVELHELSLIQRTSTTRWPGLVKL